MSFDNTSNAHVAEVVADVRLHPDRRGRILDLLSERHPMYTGRSSNSVTLLRGYLLAAFEDSGLPEEALRYVLDELQNSRDAYGVAAAAMAVRGLGKPTGLVVPYLVAAIRNVQHHDDHVTFESFPPRWPAVSVTTAMHEIVKTFAWLGASALSARPQLELLLADRHTTSARTRALAREVVASLAVAPSCCHGEETIATTTSSSAHRNVNQQIPQDIDLQDQDDRMIRTGDFFVGRLSVVTFFYTRCGNPNKCSLTVTKIAALQRLLRAEGLSDAINVAALSYDPGHDIPPRLRAYGHNRGVTFDDNARFLRARSGFDALAEYFDLVVNYGPNLVNGHQIELFVLDDRGCIASAFTRLQWDPVDVLDSVRRVAGVSSSRTTITSGVR